MLDDYVFGVEECKDLKRMLPLAGFKLTISRCGFLCSTIEPQHQHMQTSS